MDNKNFKSGFVGVIGRPNAGKSTLMNAVLGQKLAITSYKPQTTRNRISGILTEDNFQCVFIDTPGIIESKKNELDEFMVSASFSVPKDVDFVLYIVDPKNENVDQDKNILKRILAVKKTVILVINKTDKYEKKHIDKILRKFKEMYPFKYSVLISALKKTNIDKLISIIVGLLPEGPKYYPDEMITEHPERFFISELIREKILRSCGQEIPHAVAVKTDEVKQRKPDLIYVSALIYVERESQKKIIIGKNGEMIKRIGKDARVDIEDLLGMKVYLELKIKVKKNWRKNSSIVRFMGYR